MVSKLNRRLSMSDIATSLKNVSMKLFGSSKEMVLMCRHGRVIF